LTSILRKQKRNGTPLKEAHGFAFEAKSCFLMKATNNNVRELYLHTKTLTFYIL